MTEQLMAFRSYEVSVWTLQDEFITVLKESHLEQKGQIQDPQMEIKDDGTLNFSFKIPMYLHQNGKRIENPKWYNTLNGNLMVTMRKIKVIFHKEDIEKKKIYEFLITQVEESHDKGELYCSVTCEGLPFHELGKNGYKTSLSSDIFIDEFGRWEKGNTQFPDYEPFRNQDKPYATLDYWNQKLGFINRRWLGDGQEHSVIRYKTTSTSFVDVAEEKERQAFAQAETEISQTYGTHLNQNDEVIHDYDYDSQISSETIEIPATDITYEDIDNFVEVTKVEYGAIPEPDIWYYRVEMNYDGYSNANERAVYKVYEDEYVSSWGNDGTTPESVESLQEKCRLLDESESNRYNLTQKIAETFGVFCRYEYEYDDNDHIISRTVVYYNNFLAEAQGLLGFNYAYQTSNIVRNMDATDLVTKMYVKSVDSEQTASGLLTIMDADANRSKEDYLLNFDYLFSIGTINLDQYQAIEAYETKMAQLNKQLVECSDKLSTLDNDLLDLESKISVAKTSIPLDEQAIDNNSALLNELMTPTDQIGSVKKNSSGAGHVVQLYGSDSTTFSSSLTTKLTPNHCKGKGYVQLTQSNLIENTIKIYESDKSTLVDTSKYLVAHSEDTWLIYNFPKTYENKTVYIEYDYRIANQALERNPAIRPVVGKKVTFNDSGIKASSLKMYNEYDYTTRSLTKKIKNVYEKKNDEQGSLKSVTFKDTTDINSTIYAYYQYVPALYYEKVIKVWRSKLAKDEANYEKYIVQRDIKLDERRTVQEQYDNLLIEKKKVIDTFDRLMGPALREGNWTPEDYEGRNFGNTYTDEYTLPSAANSKVRGESKFSYFEWDTETFSDEQLAYYEDGVTQDKKNYLAIDLTVREGTLMKYMTTVLKNDRGVGVCYYDIANRDLQQIEFMQNFALGSESIFAFVRAGTTIKPVLLIPGAVALTSEELDVMKDTAVLGWFTAVQNGDEVETKLSAASGNRSQIKSTDWLTGNRAVVYPRIIINSLKMKDSEDELIVSLGAHTLERFQDYSVLRRDGAYYITLKPEVFLKYGSFIYDNNGVHFNNTNAQLKCTFKIGTMDNAIYLDAKEILKENAYPKVSYTIKPEIFDPTFIETAYNSLGRIVNINDYELKFENVQGYISSLSLDLDMPQNDTIEIKNYKTKFEDLFSAIVAQTEEMKKSAYINGAISSCFTNTGDITDGAMRRALTKNADLITDFIDAHFDDISVVQEQLADMFDEAGEILAAATSAQTSMFQTNSQYAGILAGFARNVADNLKPTESIGKYPPINFKPGDSWTCVDDDGNVIGKYLAMVNADGIANAGQYDDHGGWRGWNQTYDGTIKSIQGAGMSIDTEAGLLVLEAASTIAARAGNNIYLASDQIQVTGNTEVNLGGQYINIGAEQGVRILSANLPTTGVSNSSGVTLSAPVELDTTADKAYDINDTFFYNNKLYRVTATIVQGGEIIPNMNCQDTGEVMTQTPTVNSTALTNMTSSIILNRRGIELNGSNIAMNADASIDMVSSRITGEEPNQDIDVSVIHINSQDGIFLGSTAGIYLYSGLTPQTEYATNNDAINALLAENASAYFLKDKVFISAAANGAQSVFQVTPEEMLMTTSSELATIVENQGHLTDYDGITGFQLKKDYIGMAAAETYTDENQHEQTIRTLVSITPKQITLGTITPKMIDTNPTAYPNAEIIIPAEQQTPARTVAMGSGMYISQEKIWMGTTEAIYINSNNIRLQANNTELGDTIFAVGTNLHDFITNGWLNGADNFVFDNETNLDELDEQPEGIGTETSSAYKTRWNKVQQRIDAYNNIMDLLNVSDKKIFASLIATKDGIYTENIYAKNGIFSGTVQANDGYIGGLYIGDRGLFAHTGAPNDITTTYSYMGMRPGEDVSQEPGADQYSDVVLWAGGNPQTATFKVKKNGAVIAKSLYINDDSSFENYISENSSKTYVCALADINNYTFKVGDRWVDSGASPYKHYICIKDQENATINSSNLTTYFSYEKASYVTGTNLSIDPDSGNINISANNTIAIASGKSLKLTTEGTVLIGTTGYEFTIGGSSASNISYIYRGTSSLSSSTAGIYLGTDGLRIYQNSNNHLTVKLSGTDAGLILKGNITASSGSIGGWTIGSDYIGNSNTSRDASTIGLSKGSNTNRVFWAGGAYNGTGNNAPKFYVQANGKLYASDAQIEGSLTSGSNFSVSSTGTIEAKDGTIGGWTIGSDGLSFTKGKLTVTLASNGDAAITVKFNNKESFIVGSTGDVSIENLAVSGRIVYQGQTLPVPT